MSLPNEIWTMVIGQFLPVEMVYKLYSVNSTFFQLYLSLKYRTIRMEFLDNDEIEEKIVAEPHIAAHAKHLHLISAKKQPEPKKPSTWKTVGQFMSSFIYQPASYSFSEEATKTILCFTRVEELTLVWRTGSPVFVHQCIQAAQRVSGPSLTRMNLTLEASCLAEPSLPFIGFKTNALRRLDVKLWVPFAPHQPNQQHPSGYSLQPLLDYINSAAGTLAILRIWSRINVSPIFDSLDHFSRLSELEVSASHDGPSEEPLFEGLMPFLSKQDDLESLVIRATRGWSAQAFNLGLDLPNINFYKLQHFAIDVTKIMRKPVDWKSFLVHLGLIAPRLRSLSLEGTYGDRKMLKQVLSVLWESNACLEHFFLEITELGFRHLLLLEQYIPVIDSLTLSIDYIETDEGSKQLPAGFFRTWEHEHSEFIRQLREHDYSSWHIRNLTIQRCTTCCECELLGDLMAEFARCIPSITSLGGRGNLSLPAPEPFLQEDIHEIWCPHGFPDFPIGGNGA